MSDIKYEKMEKFWDNMALKRFIEYQMKNVVGIDRNLNDIFEVNDYGSIIFKNVNNLSIQQLRSLQKLINMDIDGTFRDNQLKDLNPNNDKIDNYDDWFNKQMNTYMYTVPTKEVFYGDYYYKYMSLKNIHSYAEINRQAFNGYSVWMTLYALQSMNPILLGTLLGNEIEISNINNCHYVKFKYKDRYLYAHVSTSDLFMMNEKNELVKLNESIHTLFFKERKQSIYKVINSVMYPIGGFDVLPSAGMELDPVDDNLIESTERIINSNEYKILSRSYLKNHFDD